MILRIALFLACPFMGCMKPPSYVRECDRVTKIYAEAQIAKHGLAVLGQGGHFRDKKIDSFFVDFEMPQELSADEAKKLLHTSVDDLAFVINSDANIQQYLTHAPILAKDISVSIAFVDSKKMPFQELAQIHLYDGKVYYSKYSPEEKSYIAFTHEPYNKETEELCQNSQTAASN